jgi:hypothetical protein
MATSRPRQRCWPAACENLDYIVLYLIEFLYLHVVDDDIDRETAIIAADISDTTPMMEKVVPS